MQTNPNPIPTLSTGIPWLDGTAHILGLLWLILSTLASIVPQGGPVAHFLAVVALDVRRLFQPRPPPTELDNLPVTKIGGPK